MHDSAQFTVEEDENGAQVLCLSGPYLVSTIGATVTGRDGGS